MYNGTYEFWLIDEVSGRQFKLPVVPGSFEIPDGNDIETLKATEYGDLTIVGYRKRKDIKIESFFPSHEYEFAPGSADDTDPMQSVALFQDWIFRKTVLRFIIADNISTKINERFVIEDFVYSQNNEANGDINYTLTLREFTPISTPVVENAVVNPNTTEKNKARDDGEEKEKPKTYTVKSGDCLYNISRDIYGDPNRWREIYEANKDIIGSNPNMIFPGQVYTIP